MSGKATLDRFIEDNPLSVMTRAILGQMVDSKTFDQIFDDNRSRQYEDTIPFSVLALSMGEIALGTRKNRNQAYIRYADQIGATKEAYYTKLNRTEPGISEAVVNFSSCKAAELMQHLNYEPWEVLPGYNAFSIDGNVLQKTEKRLSETRGLCAAVLPGKIVAKFNHQTSLFDNAYLLEDAHAQEATVLDRVVADLRAKELIMADRHFCIVHFFFSISAASSCFVIRHNKRLKGELIGKRKKIGRNDTGMVFEQAMKIFHQGEELTIRRITVELDEPTREGDGEIHVLSNLPPKDANACQIATIYRQRWEIENAFHVLTMTLNCEMKSNCDPRCALFQFCMAMFAYNARQVLLAALYSEHDQTDVEQMSQYQVSLDTLDPMTGMLTAIPSSQWDTLVPKSAAGLSRFLRSVAAKVQVKKYRVQKRGPKKPPPKRKRCKAGTHLSAKKILDARTK